MTVLIKDHPNLDAKALMLASGDADEAAIANSLRPLYLDETLSSKTISCFDFKSAYCNDGAALVAGKKFRNLVQGAADAAVESATNLVYHTDDTGKKDGLRFTGDTGRVLLPDTFKLAPTATDFIFIVWMQLHVALTGVNYRSFAGWTQNGGSNAYSLQARTTSLLGVLDASLARTLVAEPALDTVYQLGMRYKRDPATNALTEYLYVRGALIQTGTGYTDPNGLNQPAGSAYIGRCPGYVNTGLDFSVHRLLLEDLSEVSDRPNPDGLDVGMLAIKTDWDRWASRFAD